MPNASGRGGDYWIGFRQHSGMNNEEIKKTGFRDGVEVNWAPWVESSGGSHVLDMRPDVVDKVAPALADIGALVVGRTFSDEMDGVHITPIRKGTDGTGASGSRSLSISRRAATSLPSSRP